MKTLLLLHTQDTLWRRLEDSYVLAAGENLLALTDGSIGPSLSRVPLLWAFCYTLPVSISSDSPVP